MAHGSATAISMIHQCICFVSSQTLCDVRNCRMYGGSCFAVQWTRLSTGTLSSSLSSSSSRTYFFVHTCTHTHSSRQKKSQDFIIGLVMMCDVSTFDCHSSLIDWFVRSVNNVINSESLMFSQDHQINGDNNNENSFGIVSALKSATTKMKS